jgi:hypothetical protein
MAKAAYFGLAGALIMAGLFFTLSAAVNIHAGSNVLIGVVLGFVGFFLIGLALDQDNTSSSTS